MLLLFQSALDCNSTVENRRDGLFGLFQSFNNGICDKRVDVCSFYRSLFEDVVPVAAVVHIAVYSEFVYSFRVDRFRINLQI